VLATLFNRQRVHIPNPIVIFILKLNTDGICVLRTLKQKQKLKAQISLTK